MGYSNNPNVRHIGLYFPKELAEQIDRAKGYYTTNKFMQKITEEYLASQHKEVGPAILTSALGERNNSNK